MKRYSTSGTGSFMRFGLRYHTLNRLSVYRGGQRL